MTEPTRNLQQERTALQWVGTRAVSEHMAPAEGEAMFRHACALGLEGIVSKRLDKPYASGRCPSWVKVRNPSYVRR